MARRRIGIVGYGNLGKFLTRMGLTNEKLELAFVWNRTTNVLEEEIEEKYICRNLEDFQTFNPDLIVEVCHPDISKRYGPLFLSKCDYMIGSPTALADSYLEQLLRSAAIDHGLYVPSGAFWGSEDIIKMADRGTLKELKVTMKKHPKSFKLNEPLTTKNDSVTDSPVVLFLGPVRELCPLAPNNVNTMAAAAVAGHNLGFDGVIGQLVSDPNLLDWHVIEISVTGPNVKGNNFTVSTTRRNPANPGTVTGSATYDSFFSSLLMAKNKGSGVHLC